MIEGLQFIVMFCFWLFLALMLGSLCAIGVRVLIITIDSMKGER